MLPLFPPLVWSRMTAPGGRPLERLPQMPYLTAKSWQEFSRNTCFLRRAAGNRWEGSLPSPASSCVVIPAPGALSLAFAQCMLDAAQVQLTAYRGGIDDLEIPQKLNFEASLKLHSMWGLWPKPSESPCVPFGSSFFNHSLMFFWLGHWLMDDVNLLYLPPFFLLCIMFY